MKGLCSMFDNKLLIDQSHKIRQQIVSPDHCYQQVLHITSIDLAIMMNETQDDAAAPDTSTTQGPACASKEKKKPATTGKLAFQFSVYKHRTSHC